jgi:signal peptidase II
LLRVALGLQLGGALGNLLDRFTQGGVTDFLDFGPWPVFNIADAAVVAGVILMAYVLLQEERNTEAVTKKVESPQSLSDN